MWRTHLPKPCIKLSKVWVERVGVIGCSICLGVCVGLCHCHANHLFLLHLSAGSVVRPLSTPAFSLFSAPNYFPAYSSLQLFATFLATTPLQFLLLPLIPLYFVFLPLSGSERSFCVVSGVIGDKQFSLCHCALLAPAGQRVCLCSCMSLLLCVCEGERVWQE